MKKSVLSIGAVLLMGGLGSAHAVYYFGAGTTFGHTTAPQATELRQNAGGTGHMLYVPYYSVQGASASYINITNTDKDNGKAVKVRFRGAANSDDVLDFTLLLSPRDVWTARITKDQQGHATISTEDNSCTLPTFPASGQPFITQRLAGYLTDAAKLSHTREGYVEILNMADIPPGTKLFEAIEHSAKGVPGNCNATAVQTTLINQTGGTAAIAQAAGLAAPTGQLMGSWAITNTSKVAMYGGAMPAVQATNGSGVNGYGNIIFSPQVGSAVSGVTVNEQTADPLLVGGLVNALWYDLPDMSTPLVPNFDSRPNKQVASIGILHSTVNNEYAADPTNAVPMTTDWVFSQPTRRYYAALDYKTSANEARIVWTDVVATNAAAAPGTTSSGLGTASNAYSGLNKQVKADLGAFACLPVVVGTVDREERTVSAGASFSPGNQASVCGEVFTLSFGGSSVLGAELTNVPVTSVGKEGWGYVTIGGLGSAIAIPVVGFSATSVYAPTIGNFGLTLPYRW
ncbi:MAG: hypothetical protein ACTTJV_01925 [Ottowia sp.]